MGEIYSIFPTTISIAQGPIIEQMNENDIQLIESMEDGVIIVSSNCDENKEERYWNTITAFLFDMKEGGIEQNKNGPVIPMLFDKILYASINDESTMGSLVASTVADVFKLVS